MNEFPLTAIRCAILDFPNPTQSPSTDYRYFEDGLLLLEQGKVKAIGPAGELLQQYPLADVTHYPGKLLVPGFIDSHLHFPQTEMIASYGEQLLEWLENYTFPTERQFEDPEYAAAIAQVFLRQLHKNGTTSAMVYSTLHKGATDALFQAASDNNMLMIAGKVCMDRNCPPWLQDTAQSAQQDSAALIDKWHGKQRQYYAITPRFAPTSTEAQMQALGELAQQYPDVFIQSHLSENKNEIDWALSLYPGFDSYLSIYDHYHMVRERAVYGHCIHLQDREWQRLAESGAAIAFCPTSNLFLGSGLFNYDRARAENVPVTLATDVGAGTSFSMLKTMGEAYKVCQLQQSKLPALQGLYDMTQGSALALGLQDKIGNLNPGTDADFVILDPAFDELCELRTAKDKSPENILFALSMLGDDRAVHATWIAGQQIRLE